MGLHDAPAAAAADLTDAHLTAVRETRLLAAAARQQGPRSRDLAASIYAAVSDCRPGACS